MLFSGSVKPVKLIGSKRENFKKIKLQLKRQSVRGEGERLGEIKKKKRERWRLMLCQYCAAGMPIEGIESEIEREGERARSQSPKGGKSLGEREPRPLRVPWQRVG